jgi:AcrR family transcriptional regulator
MAAHSPEAKHKIVEAAIRLVCDHGFGSASIVRIRQAAGVSNGSFYVAFGARERLFDHLLAVIETSHRPVLAEALSAATGRPQECLARIVLAHIGWLTTNARLARLRYRLVQGLTVDDPARNPPAVKWEAELLATWARPLMIDRTIRPMSDLSLHALTLGAADAVVCHEDIAGSEDLSKAWAPALAEAAWVAIRGGMDPEKVANRATAGDRTKRARKMAVATEPDTPDLFADDRDPVGAKSKR